MLFHMAELCRYDYVKNLEVGREFWVTQCTLKAILCILIRGGQREISRHPEDKAVWRQAGRESTGLARSDMAINQNIPAATRKWKEQGMEFPLQPLEKTGACRHQFCSVFVKPVSFWLCTSRTAMKESIYVVGHCWLLIYYSSCRKLIVTLQQNRLWRVMYFQLMWLTWELQFKAL